MSDDAPPRCKVILEDWVPEIEDAIWGDLSPDALRTGFDAVADFLTSLVDRPDDVTLVIPRRFPEAVMRRDPTRPYSVERGSGLVGGRTMRRADGGVDVIIGGEALVDVDDSGIFRLTAAGQPRVDPEGVELLRPLIAHEAQHVNMELSGSAFDNYGLRATWPVARRYQFAVAAKMCDEHRAEWNAAQVIGTDPPKADQILDVLCHMGQELEAAATRFRQSIKAPVNLEELREGVYAATHSFWTQVAYWAAEHREDDEISQLPADITQLKIWQRYVGPTWESMTDALSQLPTALATSPEALNRAATGVAVTVSESLQHVGFRHFNGPTLLEFFYIDRYDFPSARE